jgi:hypothetical protein
LSLTQLSADEKVLKLFALALLAETPVGRNILRQRCDPEFDTKRKERANRFKGTKACKQTETDDSDSEGDDVVTNPTQPHPEQPQMPKTQFTKMSFDPDDDNHIGFVDSQLRRHGLEYMIQFLAQMSDTHSLKAYSIVWTVTCSLIKDSIYSTDQVEIPNSNDQSVAVEWRHCPDRRAVLHSNKTNHPIAEFYASNPVASNTTDSDEIMEEPTTPRHSIDCETVDDLTEIIQLFLSFHAFYKYGASLFSSSRLLATDMKVREI